jgi:hypothetical protein
VRPLTTATMQRGSTLCIRADASIAVPGQARARPVRGGSGT